MVLSRSLTYVLLSSKRLPPQSGKSTQAKTLTELLTTSSLITLRLSTRNFLDSKMCLSQTLTTYKCTMLVKTQLLQTTLTGAQAVKLLVLKTKDNAVHAGHSQLSELLNQPEQLLDMVLTTTQNNSSLIAQLVTVTTVAVVVGTTGLGTILMLIALKLVILILTLQYKVGASIMLDSASSTPEDKSQSVETQTPLRMH